MQETLQKQRLQDREEEPVRIDRPPHKLWFEHFISNLHLPVWFGIPIISLVPAIALWSIGITIRIATDFTGIIPVSLPLLVLNMLFLVGSSRLISLKIEQLRHYTAGLTHEVISEVLNRLYDFTPIIVIWAILVLASGFVFDPIIFRLYYSPYQSLLRVGVTSYLRLAQATFLWILGYSMYSIYKWGKLPIRLKSFVEDPTLGLKTYGTTSLYFVTLYIVGVLLTFPVGVYGGDAVRISQSIFFLLGIVIFLIPLQGLRRKLLQAKQEKLNWIGARHRRVMDLVESSGEGRLDTGIVNELIAIDTIRRDVHQIHGWPFNPGIMVKLVTVVMLPLVLAMIATYLIHLLQL